jgi:hypothetical protein
VKIAKGKPFSFVLMVFALCHLGLVTWPVRAADDIPALAPEDGGWFARSLPVSQKIQELENRGWHFGGYVDLGYVYNFNQPANGLWRSKGTTFELNNPRVNMFMGYVQKDATPQSRWGLEFGAQGGIDTDNLVTESPPPANKPIGGADTLRHFYRANASYLFPVGNGLEVTAGLINSYIGHESYHAIQNPNYTRGYLADNVPYFMFGVQASYPVHDTLTLSLFSINGYNYLANPNDQFSYGLQMIWEASPKLTLTQNFYYGPDQERTNLQFWRFLSDSILEWKSDEFLLAFSYDVGTEKQAERVGDPQFVWMASAVWTKWHVAGPWSLAFRPELYWDPQGLISGAEQLIQAYTTTLEYQLSFLTFNKAVAMLEYRYDRSTGSGGGFYKGVDNRLVSNQHQVLLGLMWTFDS